MDTVMRCDGLLRPAMPQDAVLDFTKPASSSLSIASPAHIQDRQILLVRRLLNKLIHRRLGT
jgi:hypothetical protein